MIKFYIKANNEIFFGNWKMFGVPKSINIIDKINSFHLKDKNRKKYRVIITPLYPY